MRRAMFLDGGRCRKRHHPEHSHRCKPENDAEQWTGFGHVRRLDLNGWWHRDVGHAVVLGDHCSLDHCAIADHMRGMADYGALSWSEHRWVFVAAVSATLVVISSLADRRRNRRADIEAVGFMPWTIITVFSVLATVIAAALAIKGL